MEPLKAKYTEMMRTEAAWQEAFDLCDERPEDGEMEALGFRWSPKRAAWYFKPAA